MGCSSGGGPGGLCGCRPLELRSNAGGDPAIGGGTSSKLSSQNFWRIFLSPFPVVRTPGTCRTDFQGERRPPTQSSFSNSLWTLHVVRSTFAAVSSDSAEVGLVEAPSATSTARESGARGPEKISLKAQGRLPRRDFNHGLRNRFADADGIFRLLHGGELDDPAPRVDLRPP